MFLPTLQSPTAIVMPAPSSQELEAALLEAFDWGRPLPPANGKGPAALRYQWLLAAATYDPARGLPANPFATGAAYQEAAALPPPITGHHAA